MARILQSGFETGLTSQIGSDAIGSIGGSVSIVSATPAARSGTYCLKCTVGDPSNATTWSAWLGKKTISHSSNSELWYAFGFRAVHDGELGAGSYIFFIAYDSAGNANIICTIDSGTIRAYYATAGGSTPSFAQCTLIGAASSSMSMDAWHLIEIHIVPATDSTGTFELYLDGASVISATLQRTAQANANLASFALVQGALQGLSTAGGSGYHAFDDLRVNDTSGTVNNAQPGDAKIVMVLPTGAGTTTQLSRGGTDSGANWSQVDDVPPNDVTDYVYSATAGQKDTYTMSNPPAIQSCEAVNVIVQAMNSDAGGGSIQLLTRTGAGESAGSSQSITATPSFYKRLLEVDPADSAAWDQTKLNALEVGIEVQ